MSKARREASRANDIGKFVINRGLDLNTGSVAPPEVKAAVRVCVPKVHEPYEAGRTSLRGDRFKHPAPAPVPDHWSPSSPRVRVAALLIFVLSILGVALGLALITRAAATAAHVRQLEQSHDRPYAKAFHRTYGN